MMKKKLSWKTLLNKKNSLLKKPPDNLPGGFFIPFLVKKMMQCFGNSIIVIGVGYIISG